jgi:hypothetical protein
MNILSILITYCRDSTALFTLSCPAAFLSAFETEFSFDAVHDDMKIAAIKANTRFFMALLFIDQRLKIHAIKERTLQAASFLL